MTFSSYLINLDGSEDRLAHATQQLNSAGISFTRIPAYDGRGIDTAEIEHYNESCSMRYIGRAMTGGEIGCYISHQRAVAAFLESGSSFGIVFEDDFTFCSGGAERLQVLSEWLQTNKAPQDWYVMNIGATKRKISSAIGTVYDFEVFRAHYFPMLATGMIWTRKGAEEFLDISQDIYAPVDNLYRLWLTKNNKGLSVQPAIVFGGAFESDIDGAETKKRKKEKRSFYYGFAKQRRLWGDKIIASRHKFLSPKN